MSMQDPIANMLTIIRNGQNVDKQSVTMPSSSKKVAIVEVLKAEGYIKDYKVNEGAKPTLSVYLKYHNGTGVIDVIKRVSKCGMRVYRGYDDIPKVLGGLGIAVVSTSQGVMTDHQARQRKVGGEIICYVS